MLIAGCRQLRREARARECRGRDWAAKARLLAPVVVFKADNIIDSIIIPLLVTSPLEATRPKPHFAADGASSHFPDQLQSRASYTQPPTCSTTRGSHTPEPLITFQQSRDVQIKPALLARSWVQRKVRRRARITTINRGEKLQSRVFTRAARARAATQCKRSAAVSPTRNRSVQPTTMHTAKTNEKKIPNSKKEKIQQSRNFAAWRVFSTYPVYSAQGTNVRAARRRSERKRRGRVGHNEASVAG